MENYALSRGKTEPERLDIQHKLWTKNLGYDVHPSIASRLNAFSRIADIGTGTGIFLIELSRQLPTTCQLDGFDISDTLYPSPTTLPANVSLTLQDARRPFPGILRQTYDFVHVKLMVSGLEKDDWEVVAANASHLLKPGGAIQWAEADFLGSAYLRGGSETIPRALEHVGRRFHVGMGHRLRYGYSTLPAALELQGLCHVLQDIVASDRVPETREALTRVSYDGIFGWAHKLHDENLAGAWTLQEIEDLKAKIEKEIKGGGYCRYEIYVTMGFA